MSMFAVGGISTLVRRPHRTKRVAWLTLIAATLAGVGGCGMRPLSNEELFSRHDAGRLDASIDRSAPRDAVGHDAPTDRRASGDAQVARDSGRDAAEAGRPDVGPPRCSADGCATDQFCDDLTGRCAPRAGAGMLGGVIMDRCTGRALSAKVGIAGRHVCSYAGKGSYFLTGLPLGTLRLAVALEGYELVSTTVVIAPGGTVADVTLTPAAPLTCTDPPPDAPPCTCVQPGCL